MTDLAIDVQRLTKVFRLYPRGGDRIREMMLLGSRKLHREVRALSEVSFQVERGEALGIIGDNGSGKSTLLRVLGGILAPTSGSSRIYYPASVLIELAAGYDIQAPGRDNIIFQCRLLGMSSAQIQERMSEIIEFAELGPAIDLPMKIYSTGMRLRLAFSVALGLRREVMLIDEVLAVGDEYFQSKCFKRIKEIKASDQTIVYVSHALGTVRSVCDRTVWLRGGEVAAIGESWSVIDQYMDYVRGRMGVMLLPQELGDSPASQVPPSPSAKETTPSADEDSTRYSAESSEPSESESVCLEPTELVEGELPAPPAEPSPDGILPRGSGLPLTSNVQFPWARQGSHEVEIFMVETLDGEGRPRAQFTAGEPMTIRLHYMAHREVDRPNFGVAIYRNDGLLVYGTSSHKDDLLIERLTGPGMMDFVIPRLSLMSGSYEITVAIFDEDDIYKYDYHTRLYPFSVQNPRHDEGTMRLRHHWRLRPRRR